MAVFAPFGLDNANDVLRAVDIASPEADDLARTQTCGVAESKQHLTLKAPRHGQEALGLVRAHHQRDLLGFFEVIDLGGKIQSPQRHTEQEPEPGHDAVAIANLAPVSIRCSWNRRISSAVAVSGERCKYAANRLQLLMWLLCVCGLSLRALMSSIMRWRSGLTASVPMGTLLSEVDDASIFRKGPTARHHCCFKYSACRQQSRPASAGYREAL